MVSVLSLATNDLSLARVRGQTCDHGDHREQLGCKQQSGVKTDKQMVMMMMMSPIQMKMLTPGWWLVLVRKWPGVTLGSTLAGSLQVTWPGQYVTTTTTITASQQYTASCTAHCAT